MRTGGTILLVAACAALGIATWAILGHRAETFSTPTSERTSDALTGEGDLQFLVEAQHRQDRRMDRLEAMIERIATRSGGDAQGSQAQAGAQGPDPDDITPAQRQAQYEQRWRSADANFATEPVSKAWADKTQRQIGDAFSPSNLASKGAPRPRQYDSTCRSRTCKIEVVYGNDTEAEAGQLWLLSDIGGVLGSSVPFQRTLADGSVQLVMYSSIEQRPPPREHRH